MKTYEENINWMNDEKYKYSCSSIDGKQTGNILIPLNRTKKYPVLYLLHGMGAAGEWQNSGISRNLNNWIDTSNIQPVIVVMPTLPKYGKVKYESDSYQKFIVCDLITLMAEINKEYGNFILKGCENMIIAGASMGGAAALYAGVLYSDKFMHVGAISPSQQLHTKEGKGWVESIDQLKLNPCKSAVQFAGYGKGENDFKDYVKNYIFLFKQNGFTLFEGIVDGMYHGYETFYKELRLFLTVISKNQH